jgi:hypothetical protein
MVNRETFPPEADITYESFFDRAMQAVASSGLLSVVSLVIRIPFDGCQSWGATVAVDCNNQSHVNIQTAMKERATKRQKWRE